MHANLYSDVFNYNNADIKSFILSRLTSSLKVKRNIFLLAFEFERCIEDSKLQDDALLETSSAKMKTRNRAAIGYLIYTLTFMVPFRHSFSGTSG